MIAAEDFSTDNMGTKFGRWLDLTCMELKLPTA